MQTVCKYKGEQVLLVEGKNDCHAVLALCRYHSLPESFGIFDCESDVGILRRLNALILQPDPPKTIGIVMDADHPDIRGRWFQIQGKIAEHKYTFPATPDLHGTVLPENSGKPRIGIWLMPNNKDSGMLEDFLMKMADKATMKAVSDCLETALSKGLTFFKHVHLSKALIHTYLAWQDEPGKTPGQSITSHALKPDAEIADIFVNWLKRLFLLRENFIEKSTGHR
ncbi:MAG: DUF3226 domain-containing protein [Desulfococcaceae bacterium]